MDALTRLGEQRITEAMQRGELDDVPGMGQPLDLEDLSRLEPGARSAYLVLRGSGHVPEEMQLRKEMVELRDLLHAAVRGTDRQRLQDALSAKRLRYELLMEARGITVAHEEYTDAIDRRLSTTRLIDQ